MRKLLDEKGHGLHALLLRLTLCRETAEDLVQELFMRLARSKQRLVGQELEAYAFRVAIIFAA